MKKIFCTLLLFTSLTSFGQQWKQYSDRKKGMLYADSFYLRSSYSGLPPLRMVVVDTVSKKVFHQIIPSGGASTRFGVTGEDISATAHRSVDFNSFDLLLTEVEDFDVSIDNVAGLTDGFTIGTGLQQWYSTSTDGRIGQFTLHRDYLELYARNAGSTAVGEINVFSNKVYFNQTSGAYEFTNLPNTTTANVVYYDPTTDRITYGAAPGGGGTTLAALTDVTLTSIATNDFLKYNGTAWINRTPANVKTDLSLNNVENTALSTWAGSSNLTTIGTLGNVFSTGYMEFAELSPDPGTSAASTSRIFVKPDGLFYGKDDAGVVTQLSNSAASGVTDVTGTANRITSSGGATPSIDISSAYVGQSSITTLGTIGTGVWNGTALTSTYLPGTTVYTGQSNTYTAGMKQIFTGNSTTAAVNFAGVAGDPSALANGDLWHNTTSNTFNYRANAQTRTIANLNEIQTLTSKTIDLTSNTFISTSAQLGTAVTDETGTGLLVFATSPNFTTGITIGSVAVPTISSTNTLTNKRITQRVTTIASSATPTPDGDASDVFTVTALAAAATFAAPTGTPTDGQKLLIRVKDNATARTLAWNAIYRAGTDVALPTTTTVSKTMYVLFIYNSADAKFDLLSVTNGY